MQDAEQHLELGNRATASSCGSNVRNQLLVTQLVKEAHGGCTAAFLGPPMHAGLLPVPWGSKLEGEEAFYMKALNHSKKASVQAHHAHFLWCALGVPNRFPCKQYSLL